MEQEKATYTIRLSDNDIESIINDGTISIEVSENVCVEIGQTLTRDIAMPIVNNDIKVFSKAQIRNVKQYNYDARCSQHTIEKNI